ncbi:MAG: hypothetical protein RLO21_16290, partial [Nitratireductor sp.]
LVAFGAEAACTYEVTLAGADRQERGRSRRTDPPDSASALDHETSAAIIDHRPDIPKGRRAAMVAHRRVSLSFRARIVAVEIGEPIDDATQTALLSAKKRYAELWNSQNGNGGKQPCSPKH